MSFFCYRIPCRIPYYRGLQPLDQGPVLIRNQATQQEVSSSLLSKVSSVFTATSHHSHYTWAPPPVRSAVFWALFPQGHKIKKFFLGLSYTRLCAWHNKWYLISTCWVTWVIGEPPGVRICKVGSLITLLLNTDHCYLRCMVLGVPVVF